MPEGFGELFHRHAREVCRALGAGWLFYVSVNRGGHGARVVFLNGKDRVVISSDGKVASMSITDPKLSRAFVEMMRRRTEGSA